MRPPSETSRPQSRSDCAQETPATPALSPSFPQTTTRPSGRELAAIAIVLALTLAFRIYHIDRESLWYDEVVSVMQLDQPSFSAFLHEERKWDPAIVPVYFWLEYTLWHTVSRTELGLRMLSVLFGVGTVALLWWTGRTMFSPAAGMVAAVCGACAVLHIYQSQEIRMYGLMYLLALLSVFCFYQALVRKGSAWWLAHALASALLVWTHLFGTLVLLAQGLTLLWFWRRRISWCVLWGLLQSIYLIPLAWWIMQFDPRSLDSSFSWIPPVTADRFAAVFYSLLTGTDTDARAVQGEGITAAFPITVGVILWGSALWFAYTTLRPEKTSESRETDRASLVLLTLWCFVPVLALLVLSQVVRPCFIERYLAHCAFPLFLAGGAGLSRIPGAWLRRSLMAALVVAFVNVAAELPRPFRPDLRQSARTLMKSRLPTEPVFAPAPFNTGLAFKYYTGLSDEELIYDRKVVALAVQRIRAGEPCWVLVPDPDRRDVDKIRTVCMSSDLRFVQIRFSGRQTLYLFHALDPAASATPNRNLRE